MADEPEKSGPEPNLELPSLLSFGRNRKRRKSDVPDDPGTEQTVAQKPVAEAASPQAPDSLVADPVAQPPSGPSFGPYSGSSSGPRGGLVPPAGKAKRLPLVPPPTAHTSTPEPLDAEQGSARRGTAPKLPAIGPRAAVVVTGALVGFLGVLLAYFASRGCETVRGVGSCGGMGLLALLLIVAIEVVLGAILLKAWQISDATSTSFLGVGLVTAFVLLFLLGSLESVWMILVIPVLSGLAFLLSWWVTTAFVEVPGEDAHR